ncbi:MAG: class I SAM-dependent methyltransferase [Patescibacteria group bacterium]
MEFFRGNSGIKKIRDEDRQLSQRIAALNSLTPSDVKPHEVGVVYSTHNLRYMTSLTDKYVGQHGTERGKAERFQQFGQLAETLLDLPPTYFSYGLFASSYIRGLQRQQEEPRKTGEPQRTLLAGALTEDTVKEYTSSVRFIHPDALCYVTDVEGESTSKLPEASGFVYGDAQRLSFADGVFDSVHTNILLPNLTDNSPLITFPETKRTRFFAEAARVLNEDGRLLLVEEYENISDEELREAGFSRITREPALTFSSRRDMERSLKHGETDGIYEVTPSRYVDFVMAAK